MDCLVLFIKVYKSSGNIVLPVNSIFSPNARKYRTEKCCSMTIANQIKANQVTSFYIDVNIGGRNWVNKHRKIRTKSIFCVSPFFLPSKYEGN